MGDATIGGGSGGGAGHPAGVGGPPDGECLGSTPAALAIGGDSPPIGGPLPADRTTTSAVTSRGRERSILVLLLAVAYVHAAAYALIVPTWQAPDELGHFEHITLLARDWPALSVSSPDAGLERELIASLYASRYFDYVGHYKPEQMPLHLDGLDTFAARSRTIGRPSLAYVLQAPLLLPLLHQDVDLQVDWLRLLSAMCAPVMVVLVWRVCRLLVPSRLGVAVAGASFLTFLPQHAFLMGSITDGDVAELLAGAVFALYAATGVRGLNLRRTLCMGVSLLAALLTKNTSLFLVPALVLAFPVVTVGARVRGKRIWTAAAILLALAALGSHFGPRSAQFSQAFRFVGTLFDPQSYSLARILLYGDWCVQTFESFWGRFGWMIVRLPVPLYAALFVAQAVALGRGVSIAVSGRGNGDYEPRVRRVLLAYAISLVLSVVVLLASFVVYFSPSGSFSQGRYLFACMVPIAVLTGFGVEALLRGRGHRVAVVVAALYVAMSAYALFGVTVSAFR